MQAKDVLGKEGEQAAVDYLKARVPHPRPELAVRGR